MNPQMEEILARKLERRKQLAALPVGEKLRMLEEMMADLEAIAASRPPKPANPLIRKGRRAPILESA